MTFPARRCTALALLAGCLLLVPAVAGAAKPKFSRAYLTGTHAFRLLLHRDGTGLKPLESPDAFEIHPPGETLLIVFGSLKVLDHLDGEMPGGLQGFLDNGGAILVASERGNQANTLFKILKVRPVEGVVTNLNGALQYQNHRGCPLVNVFPNLKHPLFQGVRQGLATNFPTYLDSQNPALKPLARFPADSWWTDNPRGDQPKAEVSGSPFAMGNDGPQGQILVVAGHGVFMNGTMAHLDNCIFARNCIDWLSRGPSGRKRTHALFVDENVVRKVFKVDLTHIPGMPMPNIEILNRGLRNLEEENFFNRNLLKYLGPSSIEDPDLRMELGRERLVKGTIIVLSVLLVLYGLRRLRLARHRYEVTVPLVATGVAQTVPTEPLVAQRHRNMLMEDNLWEAARDLARECFAAYAERAAVLPPPWPQIIVRGRWLGRGELHKRVRKLWELAYGSEPRPFTQVQFHQLVAAVDEVKAALASGHLSFQAPVLKGWGGEGRPSSS
jgi:hypothetical protein